MPSTSKKTLKIADPVEEVDTDLVDDTETDDEDQDEVQTPAVEMVSIPFRGKTFTIPKEMDEWSTEACLAFSSQEQLLAAKLLLGPPQWALLQSLGAKRKDTIAFLVVLGDAIRKHCTV